MEPEVIHGATPLETALFDTHPRLFLTRAQGRDLTPRLKREPYASLLARLLPVADAAAARTAATMGGDCRGHGCATANLAMAWRMTANARYYDATLRHMETMTAYENWGTNLVFGHLASGFAIAFDWLYHTFDDATRQRYAACLHDRATRAFEALRSYSDYHSFGYTCNTLPVTLAGLAAAGGALYGVIPGTAPWLRLCLDKGHLMADSLGPDGVSPEGVAYGQYYAEFTAKFFTLVRDLLGSDLFAQSPWFKAFGTALTYHAFPRKCWRKDAMFFQFGDSDRSHWYGPDSHLRRFASATRDGRAQWLADAINQTGVGINSNAGLNLAWHDGTVKPQPPRDLPTLGYFEDMGVVVMRSDWSGRESVLVLKCGPAAGHHGHRRTNHTPCGGHMYPNNGGILLFAHGDLLLTEPGYLRKMSAYHNVALVNGRGQIGEGGDWFEDIEYRKGHPVPKIVSVKSAESRDDAVADLADAYPAAAGLTRYRRHVVFIKPSTWIVLDEFETGAPATFDILFHGPAPFAILPSGAAATEGATGALAVTRLDPEQFLLLSEEQPASAQGTGHPDKTLHLLRAPSRTEGGRHLSVIALQAYPKGRKAPPAPRWKPSKTGGVIVLGGKRMVIRLPAR